MVADIEPYIFTEVANALRGKYGADGIYITGEYAPIPAKFPAVCFSEENNYLTHEHLDSAEEQRYRTLMYEVNIYSNKSVGRKKQAREILSIVNETMMKLNFIRTLTTQAPNASDGTIYRIVARYRAETDGEMIYRR